MPIYQTGVTPAAAGTAIITAAGYTALLTAMAAASDGDLGQDTSTGNYWVAWVDSGTGNVILVPPEDYEAVSGYFEDAGANKGYCIPADDWTAMAARGWSDNGGYSTTKAVDGPLIIDGAWTGSAQTSYAFFAEGDTQPTRMLAIMKIEMVAGSNASDSAIYMSGVTHRFLLNPASGTLGKARFGSASKLGSGELSVASATWVFFRVDVTDNEAITEVFTESRLPTEHMTCERSQASSATVLWPYFFARSFTGSAAHTLHVHEAHFLELT